MNVTGKIAFIFNSGAPLLVATARFQSPGARIFLVELLAIVPGTFAMTLFLICLHCRLRF